MGLNDKHGYFPNVDERIEMSAQLTFPLSGDDKASFENFWVGHNSELVTAITTSVKTSEPRVVYLYGAPSSGKSHLLFAAMRLAKEEVISTSYLSLSDPYVSVDMLSVVDVAHLVCIDDIQLWAGNEEKERALFTLFEQIKHAGGQLIISAAQPPEQSGFIIRDLVSRLSSGLIYPLLELSENQQFEAIKMRAKHRGLSIADDVLRFMLTRSARNIGELLDLLDKIDHASLVEKRKITIPFLQQVFANS